MKMIDWIILWASILGVLAAGLPFRKYIKSVKDYLLAGRTQPWYLIAPSCQAVQSDVGDYFGAAAFCYQHGLLGFAWYAVCCPLTWLIGAHTTVPAMYRSGVWTPAEFLEVRFNAPARLWGAALILLQRLFVMGNMILGTALLFKVLTGTPLMAGAILALGLGFLYVLFGGVAATVVVGTAQQVLMTVAAWSMFIVAWVETGGFPAVWAKFPEYMHIGFQPSNPQIGWGWGFLGLMAGVIGYAVYQAEQISRPLSARTEWDGRMGYIMAGPICIFHQAAIIPLGVFALIMYGVQNPSLTPRDILYPKMMVELLPSGLLGICAAGVMAATISTIAANSMSCAGIATRDVYARLFKHEATDRHYLNVSRVITFVWFVLGVSLVPIIAKGGMMNTWMKVTGAFVAPLFPPVLLSTIYPRSTRWSGFLSMILGGLFGTFVIVFPWAPLTALLGPTLTNFLVFPFTNTIFATIAYFVVCEIENALRGRMPKSEWVGKVVWTLPENMKQYANTRDALQKGNFVEAPSNLDIDASLAGDLVVLKNKVPIYGASGLPWFKNLWTWTVIVGLIVLAITIYFW
jgi:SSS family solute:Na+ symporter